MDSIVITVESRNFEAQSVEVQDISAIVSSDDLAVLDLVADAKVLTINGKRFVRDGTDSHGIS